MALLVTLFFILISLQSRIILADFSFKFPSFPILLPTVTPTPFLHFVIPTIKIPLITFPPLSPSSTPVPPSATPIQPTTTPIPPTTTPATVEPTTALSIQEATAATQDTQSEDSIIDPKSGASLTATPPTLSPTPQIAQKGGLTQMEMILGGVGGLFGIVILVLLWPKVKLFIHDKTA